MNPENPLFKHRFMAALNVKLKKHFKGEMDYTAALVKEKATMVAGKVLQEMGIKGYDVTVSINSIPGGKAHMAIAFRKTPQTIKMPDVKI
jgi:hypothetical protein